jgi:hypothetical protein
MKQWQGIPAMKNDRKWIGVREKHTQNQNGGLHQTTLGQSLGGNSQEQWGRVENCLTVTHKRN